MAQAQTQPTSSYDVFISYSHADQQWVWEWLVPRLKAAQLKVCTDRESFDIGVPSLNNMANAVANSRHTLLVLTEAWVKSQWTRYEALLAQTKDPSGLLQHTLPLLRQPCIPPPPISIFTYADLAGKLDSEAEFARLLDAIRGVRRLPDAGTTAMTLGLALDLNRAGLADMAAEIETGYRDEIVRDLAWHDFRGIYQFKQNIRLPLADIYQELGFLRVGSAEEHRKAREQLPALDETARLAETERRMDERAADALARSQRLVILGDPGAGKTTSLKHIALMLASHRGAERLGLAAPYLPVRVRLAYFAQELAQKPALTLDNWLFQVVPQQQASHPRLGEFVRLALERGACMVLLDGLDEVGDTAGGGALRNYDHVELSPLSPPDEVEQFLLRWYTAYEQDRDRTLPPDVAAQRGRGRVAGLLPQLLDAPSVRRLATNPLLLTILVLIYENMRKLPNRRAKESQRYNCIRFA